MKHALKSISDLGLFSFALAVGAVFIAAFAYGVWQRRATLGPLLVFLLVCTPFVLAPGALFAFGAFGGMHERYGFAGAATLGAVFVALLAVLFVPVPARAERPASPPQPIPSGASLQARLTAAFGPLMLALAYALVQAGVTFPGFDRRQLGLILAIEFLVLHSIAFLGVVMAVRLGNWRLEVLRWYVAIFLLAFYLYAAYSHSRDAALLFLVAAYGTYGGLIGRTQARDALAQVGRRWTLAFALFMALSIVFRMPEVVNRWHRDAHVLYFGLLYFLGLAAAELSGVYERRWLPKGFWVRRSARENAQ